MQCSNMYHLTCCLWVICMVVIHILDQLNVINFIFLPRIFLKDLIMTFPSPVPGGGCNVRAQLADSLDGKQLPFKAIASPGSPPNSALNWAHLSLQLTPSVFNFSLQHLYEMRAPCICCVSARLFQDNTMQYKMIAFKKSLECVLLNDRIQINREVQKSV